MRWMRDMAVLVGAAAVGLGFTGARQEQRCQDALFSKATDQCRALEQMIKYRAAAKAGDLNPRGWPVSVDPSWFEHAPPTNPLLDDGEHPWVEIASLEEAGLSNPPVRMAITRELAQFWYNPYQGVVRARVPVMVSDELAVESYNLINSTNLKTIFDTERSSEAPVTSATATPATPQSAPSATDQQKPAPVTPKHGRTKREPMIVRVHQAPAEGIAPSP